MSNLMIITDEKLRIRDTNPAAEATFSELGIPLEGQPLEDVLVLFEDQNWRNIISEIQILPPQAISREFSLKIGRKEAFFSVNICPIIGEKKRLRGYVFVGTDLTLMKHAESMLIDYTQQLENINTELERFAYIASHDLKTPVRNVAGFLTLIKRRLSKDAEPDIQEFLNYAIENNRHMYQLIQDVLEFSRTIDNPKGWRLVDINEILEKIQAGISDSYPDREVSINWDTMPSILADPIQIRQLFQNLIENGIKYNDKAIATVNIQINTQPGHYLFTIGDNGIGIPQAYHSKIFSMFTRLHTQDKYQGTGIGLAICEKIVHLYGGEISLQSEENVGSEFSFSFPIR